MVLPFFATMIIVAALGPELQKHTLPLVVSHAALIYDSVYPAELARFPKMADWLLVSLTPSAFFVAAVTTLSAFSSRTPQGFAMGAAAGFLVAYTISDLLILAFSDLSSSFGGSLLANLTGAVLVGLLAYALLYLFLVCFDLALGRPTLNVVVAAIGVGGVGVLLWVAGYYALNAFYRPLPVQVESMAALPLDGDYAPHKDSEKSAQKERKAGFSFVREGVRMNAVTVQAPQRAGKIEWRRDPMAQPFLVEVRLFNGCYGAERPGVDSGHLLTAFAGVSSLAVKQGADNLALQSGNLTAGRSRHDLGSFSLKQASVAGRIDVQTFVSREHTENFVIQDNLELVVTDFLMDMDADARPRSRSIAFAVDGRDYAITFVPPPRFQRNAKVLCRRLVPPVSAGTTLQRDHSTVVAVDGPLASVVFALKPVSTHIESLTDDRSTLSMSDVNGWVTHKGVDVAGGGYLGQLALLSVSENLSALLVGRQSESVVPEDRLFMVGEFHVQYVAGPKLMATGSADAVWKNGVRLNRTRWEQLNDSWKVGILGLLCTLLLALGRFALPALRRRRDEDPITWMPSSPMSS